MVDADHNAAQQFLRKILIGNRLGSLDMPADEVWDFQFAGSHLNVGVPWRVLDVDGILLGSCDHEQKFGLPEPVDALKAVIGLLQGKAVERVVLAPKTADLELGFESSFSLEVFNYSSGYEGWNLSSDAGQIIALGGGDIAIFSK